MWQIMICIILLFMSISTSFAGKNYYNQKLYLQIQYDQTNTTMFTCVNLVNSNSQVCDYPAFGRTQVTSDASNGPISLKLSVEGGEYTWLIMHFDRETIHRSAEVSFDSSCKKLFHKYSLPKANGFMNISVNAVVDDFCGGRFEVHPSWLTSGSSCRYPVKVYYHNCLTTWTAS